MISLRSILLLLFAVGFFLLTHAEEVDSTKLQIEAIEKSLNYKTGVIEFPSCKAKMKVPQGFRFLDSAQSKFVISDLWGNPVDPSILGLLVPEGKGVLDSNSWVFTISFDEIGYVKDDDAEDIDYEELLTSMKEDVKNANPEREKSGFGSIDLVGWAAAPFYDKDKKVLHWAKELKFDNSPTNTLNYNLRVLGKEGVFVLNAVASMTELNEVKPTIDKVISSVEFEKGSTYFDFDPDVDEVAAWTVGGLVAGKVLTKVGIFAGLLKFGKFILFGIVAAGGFVWNWIRGKKNEETPATPTNPNSNSNPPTV